QQKQAFHAISLYYELELIEYGKDSLLKNKNQDLAIKKDNNLKGSGTDWRPAYKMGRWFQGNLTNRHSSRDTFPLCPDNQDLIDPVPCIM
ncbi:MAG: hypothetical protein SV775_11355, partial [Thermodesulfobacteriota bacterium]|nr:hypothetical protein [Thermodesulfobacteriota bacterium]